MESFFKYFLNPLFLLLNYVLCYIIYYQVKVMGTLLNINVLKFIKLLFSFLNLSFIYLKLKLNIAGHAFLKFTMNYSNCHINFFHY